VEKFHKIRFKVIIARIIYIFVFSLALFFLDSLVFQKHAIYFIKQYSDIITSIWQVQATVSTLTLTATAYIIGRINSTYYGICIKDLLHLSDRKSTFGLSFWESILVSLLLLFVNGLFVFLNNILSVAVVSSISLYLTIVITLECIDVISESKKYADQAKALVNGLVHQILHEGQVDGNNADDPFPNTIQNALLKADTLTKEHFGLIIDKYTIELELKINSGTDLLNDDAFNYFKSILNSFYKLHESHFQPKMYNNLINLQRYAIEKKSDKNIASIINAALSATEDSNVNVLKVFLSYYYSGYIDPRCFKSIIDNRLDQIHLGFYDPIAIALAIFRKCITMCDRETFKKTMFSVFHIPPYRFKSSKGTILLISISYLYYLSFRERDFRIKNGDSAVQELRTFINEVIIDSFEEGRKLKVINILSNLKMILVDIDRAIKFLRANQYEWEISNFNSKWLQLDSNFLDFVSFTLLAYFTRHSVKFEELEINTLLEIKKRVNTEGEVEESYRTNFIEFCNWVGRPFQEGTKNLALSTSIANSIKSKLLEKAQIDRAIFDSNKEDWFAKKIESVTQTLKASALYDEFASDNYHMVTFTLIERECFGFATSEHDFSSSAENLRSNIEGTVFAKAQKVFSIYEFDPDFDHPDESLKTFEGLLKKARRQGLNINQSFNNSFFSEAEHYSFSDKAKSRFNEIKSQIKLCGNLTSLNGYSIYTDASKPQFGFNFNLASYIRIESGLTDEDARLMLSEYKVEDYYVYDGNYYGVQIQYSANELAALLKESIIRIFYTVNIFIPKVKIGFYTKYPEIIEDSID